MSYKALNVKLYNIIKVVANYLFQDEKNQFLQVNAWFQFVSNCTI